MPDKYLVIGSPIDHSLSPIIHQAFAQQTHQNISYEKMLVLPEDFEKTVDRFFAEGGKGLNITAPLKELAWRYAKHKSDYANNAGSVNTLIWKDSIGCYGESTDGIGLIRDLTVHQKIDLTEKEILILGAGGATRGILPAFNKYNLKHIHIANRDNLKADHVANLAKAQLVTTSTLNTIPKKSFFLIIHGLSQDFNDFESLRETFEGSEHAYDLNYFNVSKFLAYAARYKVKHYCNGLGMLVEQAAESFYLWRGVRPDTFPVIAQLQNLQNKQ